MYMDEKILKEGILYKQSRFLKSWKSRFFVITKNRFAYYKKLKTGKPRREYTIAEFDVQWKGEGKKRFYIFNLQHREEPKKNMLVRCPSQRDAEDWVRCFAQIFEEVAFNQLDTSDANDEMTKHPNSENRKTEIIKEDCPKWAEEAVKLFKSSENWELTGENKWQKDKKWKKVLIANATMDMCSEAFLDKRDEWDFVLKNYRKISSPGNTRIYHAKYKDQNIVMLVQIYIDVPFQVIVSIESVQHIYYPSKITFHEIYSIIQHPFTQNLCMISCITDTNMFDISINALKSYVEIINFKNSNNEIHSLHIGDDSDVKEDEVDYSKPMDFNQYFIYGPGGDYERDPINGGLLFLDHDLISKQRGVLTNMIKRIGKNLLSGKSIMNLSLPVNIFQKYTLLQQVIMTFGYSPIFLEKAAKHTGLERFKYVVTFAVSVLHLATSQRKSFNPIIGETYQGYLGKAYTYSEQVSHHPPITAFQIYGENFNMHGFYEFMANTSANSCKARQKGPGIVVLDGQLYYITFPFVLITGMLFGKRYYNWQGVLTVTCPSENLYSEINFYPDKKGAISGLFAKAQTPADFFTGFIHRVKNTHPIMTEQGRKAMEESAKKSLANYTDDIEAELGKIEGYWTMFLDIDNQRFWSIDEYRPYLITSVPNPLPSDSTFRSDLKAMQEENLEEAQIQKDILENIQRRDAKLRHDQKKH
ncbi:hypothetical protein SteCoe_20799 [Stentor coeruleus]|uniref:PH domain-containing protein n=1 Tax=Stentor coeruleus TaxID=5963 RepID=A0A1R2BR80_9CILI|nr:hypothetical protein SteCoe_20799 [Stentor coeruleus]